MSSLEDFKQIFYKELIEYDERQQGYRRKPWTKERLDQVMCEIKAAKESQSLGLKRTSMDYYWMRKYEIIKIDNEDHIILKTKAPQKTIRIVPREQYFEILSSIHIASDHGARDKMLHAIKNTYYIPKKAIEIFVSHCPDCTNKRRLPKERVIRRQNLVHGFNISAQFDLIDFRQRPDGEFNWILYYQDDTTKFTSLRPLRNNDAAEVFRELIKIFLTFGAPTILHLDNRHQFAARITEDLKGMWPDCVVRYKNTEIKENNQEIKQMLYYWMLENNSNKWSVGCFIVQYEINNELHSTLERSPYDVMFNEPKTALNTSNLPTSVFPSLLIDGEVQVEPKQEPIDNTPGQSSDEDC